MSDFPLWRIISVSVLVSVPTSLFLTTVVFPQSGPVGGFVIGAGVGVICTHIVCWLMYWRKA